MLLFEVFEENEVLIFSILRLGARPQLQTYFGNHFYSDLPKRLAPIQLEICSNLEMETVFLLFFKMVHYEIHLICSIFRALQADKRH